MHLKLFRGTTSKVIPLIVTNASTGAPLTGLSAATPGLVAYYKLDGATTPVAIVLSAGTVGTWSSGGFVEVDAAHTPGLYELGAPDLAEASGTWMAVVLSGVSSMTTTAALVELDAVNYQDGTRAGLTSLPNAAASAANGLPTFGTGTGQINPTSGKVPATIATGDGSDTAALKATVGVAGAGLTAIPGLSVLMASGLVVTGSTGASVVVSGLPTGKSYAGQHLYHAPSGEARTIASQTFASGNYTFAFTGTLGTEAGPFSSVSAGETVAPTP